MSVRRGVNIAVDTAMFGLMIWRMSYPVTRGLLRHGMCGAAFVALLLKGGSSQRYTVDTHDMPVSVVVTGGTRADCKEACTLIDGLSAGALSADRIYDTESSIRLVTKSLLCGRSHR